MKKTILFCLLFDISALTSTTYADDKIELEITTIKGNKELPQILYVVPWKEMKGKTKEQHNLVLHSLFGDLFDPVKPDESLKTDEH